MKRAVDHVKLLLARQSHKVDRVAGDTNRQLRVLFRVIHGVQQRLSIKDVNVDVVTIFSKVSI